MSCTINNWDMALLKDTHISEKKILQLRIEFFNVFNHHRSAWWSHKFETGDINSGTFGYVTNAGNPRIGQVALKFLF